VAAPAGRRRKRNIKTNVSRYDSRHCGVKNGQIDPPHGRASTSLFVLTAGHIMRSFALRSPWKTDVKKVLVTGGAGFIGSHLTETLLARGDRVTVVDDESTGSRDNLSAVIDNECLTYIHAGLEDPELVARLTADADDVYHLAAAVGVALIASHPIETIERNIYPTQLLLDHLRPRIERGEPVNFFLASSSEVYGKNSKSTWTEDEDLVFGPMPGL
jgi:nucleoside-diphosphate-sugar epimerase